MGIGRTRKGRGGLALALLLGSLRGLAAQDPPSPSPVRETDLWVSGMEGYHTYRIPALLASPRGAVLAFCEGRKRSSSDTGEIHLLLRRSPDGGETWPPPQVVAQDGPNVMGNPCPVFDRETGMLLLLLTRNLGEDSESRIVAGTSKGTREVWILRSADEGVTWTKPEEITRTVKAPDWTWYATGPGIGIQLRSGRLVIPCDHAEKGRKANASHVIFSDDHGKSWSLGGSLPPVTDECQAVERADGSVLLNMRQNAGKGRRAVSVSKDGGETWGDLTYDPALVEPVCQGSLLRLTEGARGEKSRILFSNPAGSRREKLTLRLSYDEGETWPVAKLLHGGPAAYSCLAALPGGDIACLYEGGATPYQKLILARITLEGLTDGRDALRRPGSK
ncbi:MAG TPA: sialidase family protein [Planctomycetota bacterium]|nr:sialidase family protein [Planctomycetota bacterium]